MTEWIYPFQGRNGSLAITQNFLWCSKKIYIMDNHRAAPWCWAQHIENVKVYSLYHIDAHYDAAPMNVDELRTMPDLKTMSFSDFLALKITSGKTQLFRWDNFIHLTTLSKRWQIEEIFLATHGVGNKLSESIQWEEQNPYEFPSAFPDFLKSYGNDGWLLDIDLDYFFTRASDKTVRFFSEEYVASIFTSIKTAIEQDSVACLTICLSPECCGGWKNAEDICYQLCDVLGLDFRLPESPPI